MDSPLSLKFITLGLWEDKNLQAVGEDSGAPSIVEFLPLRGCRVVGILSIFTFLVQALVHFAPRVTGIY